MINTILKQFFFLIAVIALFTYCTKETVPTLFQKLSSAQTGITFENTITPDDSINVMTDSFIYNGAGVAIGDINNNGLPDIFFSGNMVSSRLYLNHGDFRFEDITESAGVSTTRWATGASMVDINNNGFLDIYVSVSGPEWTTPEERANLLFLNNGDNTFREAASEFNINDTGFTTHAVFLDYNGSGYLDLFLLGNSPGEFGRGESGMIPFGSRPVDPYGFDKLYRNNGDGTFTDVSEEAGILKRLGYGLGVVATDLNGNGRPDIYVSNDIAPNDVLYINNGDGTFTDRAADFLRHTSFAGMGMDIADFTNNGWPDIMQSDMMPEPINKRKLMSGSTSYGGFMDMRRLGYFPHYTMNTLQVNKGVTENGDIIFSETARLSGVAYTDWSWSVLFGDYNNSGYKDILITNGYPKAVNDFDYMSDLHNLSQTASPETLRERELELIEQLREYDLPNYIFKNNGDLTFTNKAASWGFNHSGFSYGAAYADLNNNGRLDIVVNNINDAAFIYHNTGYEEETTNYLQFHLFGEYPNLRGIGAKLFLYHGDDMQYVYHSPYRGFMSSMDYRVHFGLGKFTSADSLRIIWPDGKQELIIGLEGNQIIDLHQQNASAVEGNHFSQISHENRFFIEIDPVNIGLNYLHRDDQWSADFNVQSLLPYQVSRQGPPVAAGDVTGNGLDDLYIGGSFGYPGVLYFQNEEGIFTMAPHQQQFESDRNHDDWDALFFDANGNGLLDLYVTSGGYHPSPVSLLLQDRLYINHGNGRFLKDTSALPQMLTSTGTVKAADFTGNGQTDLFVGGRLTPRDWPRPTRSYLLRNDGGRFTDVTADMAAELIEPGGMITDAVWIDFNDDGRPDLVTAGEWMPIRFFQNEGERFREVTQQMGLPPLRGWWNSLAAADLNGNGRMDLVAGNLGLNHTYTASPEEPFGVVAGDFSGNRTTDIILTKVIDGTEYPFYGLAKLGREIFPLAVTFNSFKSFANATLQQVIGTEKLSESLHYIVDTFASVVLLSDGSGGFTVQQLPNMAQISPIYDILITDVDSDGRPDLIVAGNLYNTEPTAARADAGNGLWLKGDGTGRFTPVGPLQSGLLAPGDVRTLIQLQTPNGVVLLVANNSDSLQVYNIKSVQK
jgi:enediyne biosynthesis protein E4